MTFAASAPNDSPGGMTGGEALRRMYRITADHQSPFEEKLTALLELGRTHLGVQAGFLTEISEDTQLIVTAVGDHPALQAGESCPLSKAYCRKTIKQDNALTVQHASVEGWEGDAAYEEFGLESYIGAKVVLDEEVYGTFCFADAMPRDHPFSEDEETFVELMAEWVSYELFQQRATEQIQEQRDQLEEFAHVVSHDLRNPLGVVQGFLDIAEETGDPEHFDRCRNALDRMELLIDDLLSLARDGELIAETETFTLGSLAGDCWEFVGTTDAELIVADDREITGDASRVQQLFENLFRNAVDHGGDDVTVRIGALTEHDGFFVEDDGPGIPEDTRENVLEYGFSMADDGTGYGLTIVQEIAEAHGWELTITNGTEGGARFEFTGLSED